jgi:hypothetical protein
MKKIVLAALMAVGMGGAFAQSFYLGGSVGETHFSADCAGASQCDKGDNGYKIFGGVHVHKYAAIEAGLASFGQATGEGVLTGVNTKVKYRTHGLFAAGALRAPLGSDATAVARLGLASVKTKLVVDRYSPDSRGTITERSIQPLFGLGLEMGVSKSVQARVDIDFTKSAEINDSSDQLRMISVGLQASF